MSVEQPGVLDAFAFDTRRKVLILAMYETRPWEGEEKQLFQLQEKLNAYASFVLDGELEDSFPEYAGKAVELQLRTRHEPDEKAWGLIRQVKDQLELQKIQFEVIQIAASDSCGEGCGCH